MFAWILILLVPISVLVLIIWDVEHYEKRLQSRSLDAAKASPVAAFCRSGAMSSTTRGRKCYRGSTFVRSRREALVAANRPWIKVDVQVGGPIFYNENGANFSLNVVLKNVGHSPARGVIVLPRVITPIFVKNGIGHFSSRDELRKGHSAIEVDSAGPAGFTLFPDDPIVQPIILSLSKDELRRATEITPAIYPRVLGVVSYRTGFDDKSHQTAFFVEVRRSDIPRPITIEKTDGRQLFSSTRAIYPQQT
jgi:hypothetical protein